LLCNYENVQWTIEIGVVKLYSINGSNVTCKLLS
jgi:hypothetical protein